MGVANLTRVFLDTIKESIQEKTDYKITELLEKIRYHWQVELQVFMNQDLQYSYKECCKALWKYSHHKYKRPTVALTIGELSLSMKEYDKAEEYFKKAAHMEDFEGNLTPAYACRSLADMYEQNLIGDGVDNSTKIGVYRERAARQASIHIQGCINKYYGTEDKDTSEAEGFLVECERRFDLLDPKRREMREDAISELRNSKKFGVEVEQKPPKTDCFLSL